MASFNSETDAVFAGGAGGYGGLGFGGIAPIGLVGIDNILGGRRNDNCCDPAATCKDVWSVDKDVLASENHLAHDICELGYSIDSKIDGVNASIKDVAYAQAMQIAQFKNDMAVGFGDVKTLIETTQLNSDLKASEAKAAELQAEVNLAKMMAVCAKGKEQ